MRLYPAGGAATFRRSKTGKDVVLGGGKFVLPPGVGMHMPITAVHHSEGIWEKAHEFIPERFLEVRSHATALCYECQLRAACHTLTQHATSRQSSLTMKLSGLLVQCLTVHGCAALYRALGKLRHAAQLGTVTTSNC